MAKAKAKTEGFIDLEMVVTKEGNQYSSWCPILDIASCGATPDEASKNLCDAVGCYIEALSEDGELEKLLRDKAIKLVQANEAPVPNMFITHCRQKISIS
jgi:predicted RNase H-like HicB family nuclease